MDQDDVERTHQLLRDTARVYSVRAQVRPHVAAVVAELVRDPLGNDETVGRLAEVLDSDRAREARCARARMARELDEPGQTERCPSVDLGHRGTSAGDPA